MLRNVAPKAEGQAVLKARRLRREMSLPEVLLWRELRKRPDGFKFRRQYASGHYVLDFFCSDARLAIEIDGLVHAMGDRPARDEVRDAWFAKAGITTFRIAAAEVLDDVSAVVAGIIDAVRVRVPLHHPAAPGGPPPRDELGED